MSVKLLKHTGSISCMLLFLMPLVSIAQNSLTRISKALSNPSADHVLVAAHRGDWRNAPENSLQGINNCIDMGVDIVEIDVRITKDNQLVLMHDKTLDRTTTGTGLVKDHTLGEIRKLYLKDGLGVATRHRIPTLEEALEVCKDKIIVFIDKAYHVLPQAFAFVSKAGMQQQCLFEGNETLTKLRIDYPELANKILFMPRVKDNDPASRRFIEEYNTSFRPAAFIFSYSATPSFSLDDIRFVREKTNVPVLVSTLWPETCAGHDDELAVADPETNWGWVIAHGATILCTDRPALMLQYLREKKLHQ